MEGNDRGCLAAGYLIFCFFMSGGFQSPRAPHFPTFWVATAHDQTDETMMSVVLVDSIPKQRWNNTV